MGKTTKRTEASPKQKRKKKSSVESGALSLRVDRKDAASRRITTNEVQRKEM